LEFFWSVTILLQSSSICFLQKLLLAWKSFTGLHAFCILVTKFGDVVLCDVLFVPVQNWGRGSTSTKMRIRILNTLCLQKKFWVWKVKKCMHNTLCSNYQANLFTSPISLKVIMENVLGKIPFSFWRAFHNQPWSVTLIIILFP